MMTICHLIHHASARRRRRARKITARRWTIGICAVTTAASLGVVAGVLIAPKSGQETRADLKKTVAKSVETIENVLPDAPDVKKK